MYVRSSMRLFVNLELIHFKLWMMIAVTVRKTWYNILSEILNRILYSKFIYVILFMLFYWNHSLWTLFLWIMEYPLSFWYNIISLIPEKEVCWKEKVLMMIIVNFYWTGGVLSISNFLGLDFGTGSIIFGGAWIEII